MIKANYHTHTIMCDGNNTAEEVAAEAYKLGMESLGFSGHMDPDIHMDWPAYVAEIRRLQALYEGKMEILLGVELDTLYPKFSENLPDAETVEASATGLPVDDTAAGPAQSVDDTSAGPAWPVDDTAAGPAHSVDDRTRRNWLSQIYQDADYIIGSTHFLDVDSAEWMSVDNTPEYLQRLVHEFFQDDYYALTKAYYELEATVVDRLHPTFIGHFDLVTRFNDELHAFDEEDPRYVKPALEAMEYLAKEKQAIFEINCGAFNRGRKAELYPRQSLLKALHDFGGEIVLSADAHQKEKLLGGFDIAAQRAKAAGFDHTNILHRTEDGQIVWESVGL